MIQPALRLPLLLLVAATLVGCTSAEQRFEQGQALEDAGQVAQAAHRYVQALRKDPGLPGARERLQATGHEAVAAYLAQARQDRARGDAVARAESVLAAEGVMLAARSVQVTLAVPPGFAASKREAQDAAIAQLTAEARSLAAGGRWPDALERLADTARFSPSPTQASGLARLRLESLAAWGDAEMAAGRYRSAIEIARKGMETSTPGDGLHHAFRSMHHDSVHAATVTVAFLPLAGGGNAGTRAFLAAVNDDLELEHWLENPPLVTALDPRLVRLQAGRRAQAMSIAQAVGIGRRLGADYVVLSSLQEFSAAETGVREHTRKTATRRGKPAAYTERSGTLRLKATASFRVLPVSGAHDAPSRRVSTSHSERFTDARYRGDHRSLKLTAAQARAFTDTGADRAREQLAGKLATKLAQAMFDAILERIP